MIKPNDTAPACFSDPEHAPERLKELFVDVSQQRHISVGPGQARRAVFRKLHGVASARLDMAATIPPELKVGVFEHQSLNAWVRFSSDAGPTDPDLGATMGIGIKLFGVPGPKALGDEGDTADFIMQNFPVFFADDASEMLAFTYAGLIAKDEVGYLAGNARMSKLLDQMEKSESSVLTSRYWAILPFQSGSQHYVKYRLDPETESEPIGASGDDYLASDLARRLAKREYRFRFMVQLRTNEQSMPLDKATVEWPESESPFVQVATLTLPQQDVCARGQAAYGESLAFNIWRVPPAQTPVGSIALARKLAYAASAQARHQANGEPLEDSPIPRACPFSAGRQPAVADTCIVKAVIHPAIGVARVGTSETGWFVGPEVLDPPAREPGYYRDAENKLKRQAARFRVYGVNVKGEIVRELTPDNADIDWHVELANTKSAWYGFQLAQDIPEAAWAPPTTLRNAAVADRGMLAITPGPRTVSGRAAPPQRFDNGKFMGKPVYLGEAFTDEQGRLLVLGGRGAAASYDNSRAVTFANNEGWHDDIADGPVNATVLYQGQPLIVVPAWVVVAPPNYGPQRQSVRTMWDLMRDVAIGAQMLPMPARPSFTFDILPIFVRMAGLQWVNAGFASGFGWKGATDLTSPDALSRLCDAGSANAELRRLIANQFRDGAVDGFSPKPWPWLYGDAMNVPPAPTPRQNTALCATQRTMLAQWAAGDFIEDYDPQRRAPVSLDQVPLADQGDTLTRAALDFVLADAFHPGCELTWVTRLSSMYMAPFRLAHARDGWIAPQPAQVLTADAMEVADGPYAGQQAGGLTRWMAVPWHTDAASCRSGYVPAYDPYVPAFWPARVPDEVLTLENYQVVMDETAPLGDRLAAFANRANWYAPFGTTSYTDRINNMIAHFDELGVVEARPGPADRDNFPAVIEVEDQHPDIPDLPAPDAGRDGATARPADLRIGARPRAGKKPLDMSTIEKVRRFTRGLPD